MLCTNQKQDSFEQYLCSQSISSSDVRDLIKSPKYWLHKKANPQEQMEAMTIGSAFHCLVLMGKENFDKEYSHLNKSLLPSPDKDFRNAENRAYRDSFIENAKSHNKTVLTDEQYRLIMNMYGSFLNNKKAVELIGNCEFRENSFYGNDNKETGIDFRVRPDAISSKNYYVSLKTCADASPDGFGRACYENGYYISEAFYFRCLNFLLPEKNKIKQAYFIAVENKAPYHVQVYSMNDMGAMSEFLEVGSYMVDVAINRLMKYKETGFEYGYEIEAEEDGILPITLPYYAVAKISKKII